MRTTLDIDEDVLQAVKEIGAIRGKTAGQVLSELARKGLTPTRSPRVRNGVPLLPHRPGDPILTVERVHQLLNEE